MLSLCPAKLFALCASADATELSWLAALAFVALIATAIGHTFNYDRDFHIPAEDVVHCEDARTRALQQAGV